jgi:lipopolysaccharide biosynthesis glycosyltransferase
VSLRNRCVGACGGWMFVQIFLFLFILRNASCFKNSSLPVNIVYIVDSYSFQYFILSVSSIAKHHHGQTLPEVNRSVIDIHVIIATGSNNEYNDLQKEVENFFQCYPLLKLTSYQYLEQNHFTRSMKQGTPHWLSTTEKLRNYIPEIIPHLTRFIYFDNDVIMTKQDVLYQLWKQDLKDSPLGLVGNVLHKVEFEIMSRFYDLTHPFVQQSFNLIPTPEHPIITIEDLQQVLPIYPNNGVMLVNATRWKELKICSLARYDLSLESISRHL